MVRIVTDDDIGLRVLRDTPVDAAEPIDIVAVHGIGAHPDDSWCKNVGSPENPQWVNWLVDESMLPAVVPQARIMRYGYQSQWFGEEAMRQKASIVAQRLLLALRRRREDYPFRPLLFLAHCFGGLVVLKALLEARHHEDEWTGLIESTTGLIFFGTPFRGAEGMSQMEMLAAAHREYTPDEIQPDVLKILEPGNEFLQEMVDEFMRTRKESNKAPLACFFELKLSNVGRIVGKIDRLRFVVSESSGCLDLNDSTSKFSLSRTHFNMNKFGKPTEEDFETVSDVIKKMVKASPHLVLARSQYNNERTMISNVHLTEPLNDPKAKACRDALFLTDPHVVRESLISAKGQRVAGTCEWILRNQIYRSWLTGDGDDANDAIPKENLLWISGGPGKGKTMMSIFLTEELTRYTAKMTSANLIFFFCGADDENRNSAVHVLRSLVYQLIGKRPHLAEHALSYLSEERKKQTISSLETLWLIFSKIIVDNRLGTMFCVVDGLDECEESTTRTLLQKLLGSFIATGSNTTGSSLKIAIVSRDIPALRNCAKVRLDPDNNEEIDHDISTFVRTRIKELSWIDGFENIQELVQKALLERAEGTFLWVGFAMHELLQTRTCTEVWRIIEDLPSGLPAIYSRMLLRIPAEQRNLCRAILQCITVAIVPLRLLELATAVGISARYPQLSTKQAALDAVVLCGPMLRLQDQGPRTQFSLSSRKPAEFVGGYEVVFVHQSARDYLLRENCDSDEVLDMFKLDSANAHFQLAQTCLDCIAQSALQHSLIDVWKVPGSRESPLLRYAVFHWHEHAKQCFRLTRALFKTHRLFRDKKNILRSNWWCVREDFADLNCIPPMLYMAAQLGLTPLAEVILAQRDYRIGRYRRINKTYYEKTALFIAILFHEVDIIELLLKRGADTNVKCLDGRTVLHLACTERTDDTVRQLVAAGARIDAKDCSGETPLHGAARVGNEVGARLLVEKGADTRAKTKDGTTVLHLAAYSGSEALVRLILKRGADSKAKTDIGKTVLHFAAQGGSEAVMRLILEREADLKVETRTGKTVLHFAAESRSVEVVQLVLGRGADVSAKTADEETALYFAASSASPAMVRFLIEQGADVTARTLRGITSLHLATHCGDSESMQLLVDSGADVEARSEKGMTPLHVAAWGLNWRGEVAQLLLDRGANIDARDNKGNTPLIVSARWGCRHPRRFCLDRGADTSLKNSSGHTALYTAVVDRDYLSDDVKDAVRSLIEKGANVEELNNEGGAAAYRNCKRALGERSDEWEEIKDPKW